MYKEELVESEKGMKCLFQIRLTNENDINSPLALKFSKTVSDQAQTIKLPLKKIIMKALYQRRN